MANILTKDELSNLTGSPRISKQKEILGNHGIKFIVDAKGEVKTTWHAVNSALESKANTENDDWFQLDNLNG